MGAFSSGYSAALGDILSQVNDAFSGKSAGINVTGVVNELMQVQEQPMTQMQIGADHHQLADQRLDHDQYRADRAANQHPGAGRSG